jgi:hypothetical protein
MGLWGGSWDGVTGLAKWNGTPCVLLPSHLHGCDSVHACVARLEYSAALRDTF